MLTIIFKRNYCSRHHFVLNPRATISFERVFTTKSWFLRIRKIPKMIKKVLFSGFEQVSILAHFWPLTWLEMFVFAKNCIFNFLKFSLFAQLWPKTWLQNLNFPNLTRNLSRNVYFCPKSFFKVLTLSIYHSFVFLHFGPFLTRNLAKNVYFYPKSLFQFLSLFLSLFCISPFSTKSEGYNQFWTCFHC